MKLLESKFIINYTQRGRIAFVTNDNYEVILE